MTRNGYGIPVADPLPTWAPRPGFIPAEATTYAGGFAVFMGLIFIAALGVLGGSLLMPRPVGPVVRDGGAK